PPTTNLQAPEKSQIPNSKSQKHPKSQTAEVRALKFITLNFELQSNLELRSLGFCCLGFGISLAARLPASWIFYFTPIDFAYHRTNPSTLYSLCLEYGPGAYALELMPRCWRSQISQSCSEVSCQK